MIEQVYLDKLKKWHSLLANVINDLVTHRWLIYTKGYQLQKSCNQGALFSKKNISVLRLDDNLHF